MIDRDQARYELAAIPAEARKVIARWLADRGEGFARAGDSWVFPTGTGRMMADALKGAAVDLMDPLSDDGSVSHANDVLADLAAVAERRMTSGVEYGITAPDGVVVDVTSDLDEQEARLTRYLDTWRDAQIVHRFVQSGQWIDNDGRTYIPEARRGRG